MNIKRLVLAIVAVWVFIFLYDTGFHSGIMQSQYTSTKSLWRPEEDLTAMMPWLFIGQLLIAMFFCLLFACIGAGVCNKKGVVGGLTFGVLLGLLSIGGQLIMYAVQPVPGTMVAAWSVSGVIEMALMGAIAGAIYRPAKAAA